MYKHVHLHNKSVTETIYETERSKGVVK